MRENACNISCQHSPLHFYGVNEGQCVGDFPKRASYEVKVKPNAGEPRRKIGQQRAADAANLLVGKHTAAEQSQGNVEDGYRNNKYNGKQTVEAFYSHYSKQIEQEMK